MNKLALHPDWIVRTTHGPLIVNAPTKEEAIRLCRERRPDAYVMSCMRTLRHVIAAARNPNL